MFEKKYGRSGAYALMGGLLGLSMAACAVEAPDAELSMKEQEMIINSNTRWANDISQFGTAIHGADGQADFYFTNAFDYPFAPILVVGDPSYNGGNPVTVRVQHSLAHGFQTALNEWDYLDGNHVDESMGWFSTLPGTHTTFNNEQIVAASLPAVTDAAMNVTFPTAFDETPVVYATQVTNNGGDPTIVRIDNVSPTGFTVQLQEERGNNGTHVAETVNYIAMSDFVKIRSDENPQNCTYMSTSFISTDENWESAGRIEDHHQVLVGVQTKNGGDPANARWRRVPCPANDPWCNDGLLEVKVDEEGSDGETAHADETIAVTRIVEQDCFPVH